MNVLDPTPDASPSETTAAHAASTTAAADSAPTSTHTASEAGTAATASELERLPRPRIRIGALLWGLVLLAVGSTVLWLTTSPARRAEALDTVLGLDGFGWTVVIVVAVGATITLLALAAVIRRLQSRQAS